VEARAARRLAQIVIDIGRAFCVLRVKNLAILAQIDTQKLQMSDTLRIFEERVGAKNYELSNHLGNVLATISDKTIFNTDHYNGIVYSAQLYYPFGWEIPTLSYTAKKYRFGFNGKEDDREWHAQDYGFRLYTPRESRFISVDPITAQYPWYTPYQFAGNKPIAAVDLDGLERYIVINRIDATNGRVVSTQIYTARNIRDNTLMNFRATSSAAIQGVTVGSRFQNPITSNSDILELNLGNGIPISTTRSLLTADEQSILSAGIDFKFDAYNLPTRNITLRNLLSGIQTSSRTGIGGINLVQIPPTNEENEANIEMYEGNYTFRASAPRSRGTTPVQGVTQLALGNIDVRPDRNGSFGSFTNNRNDIPQSDVISFIQQQTSLIGTSNINSINVNFGNANTPPGLLAWANSTFAPALTTATGINNISITNTPGANFSVTVNNTQQQSTGTIRTFQGILRP
jgi:RHS repeat-associated protein